MQIIKLLPSASFSSKIDPKKDPINDPKEKHIITTILKLIIATLLEIIQIIEVNNNKIEPSSFFPFETNINLKVVIVFSNSLNRKIRK